jgi:hypothetical protein
VQDGDRIAGADRIAFILEQPLEAAGREGAEPDFADLHRSGDGDGVARATARGQQGGRGER